MDTFGNLRMSYQYLIILWIALAGTTSNDYSIPKVIDEYCPYSDICNRTASKFLDATMFIPCCSACKCDDKCGLRLDCCFDEMDKYRLKDKGIIACVDTLSGRQEHAPFNEAYWMIQSCKTETAEIFHNYSYIPCEIYNEMGDSIVEPVSSKETGYIYVNSMCAECNKVYNYIKWDYMFLGYMQQADSLLSEIEGNLAGDDEAFVYIPPQKENWYMMRCFRDVHDTCDKNSTFETLCQTMQAYFQIDIGRTYKNPFCLLCGNRKILKTETRCKEGFSRADHGRFSILIDNSVIKPSHLRKTVMNNKSLKPECPYELDSCIQINCPEGMFKTHTGCKYFIRRWYIPSFSMQIKLISKEKCRLSITALKTLDPEKRRNPFLWMKLPCNQLKPITLSVFYEIGNDSQGTVKSFIVRLWKRTPNGINPSIIFPLLKKCLRHDWFITILGETYSFNPSFDKQSEYVQDGKQLLINKLTNTMDYIRRPKLYEQTAVGPVSEFRVSASALIFLKTFFCDQVSLPLKEVEVVFGEMRIPSKNLTFGNNEFAVNFRGHIRGKPNLNTSTVSVCLEDLINTSYQSSCRGAMSSRIFVLAQLVLHYTLIHFFI